MLLHTFTFYDNSVQWQPPEYSLFVWFQAYLGTLFQGDLFSTILKRRFSLTGAVLPHNPFRLVRL